MKDFFENVWSYFIAIVRLVFLTLITFGNGLHQILFNRLEVSNVGLYYLPLRKDREKISYINKLNMNNIDLIQPYAPNELEDELYGDDEELGGE